MQQKGEEAVLSFSATTSAILCTIKHTSSICIEVPGIGIQG